MICYSVGIKQDTLNGGHDKSFHFLFNFFCLNDQITSRSFPSSYLKFLFENKNVLSLFVVSLM